MEKSFTNSRALFARAGRVIPGGVNSPARAFGAVGGSPLFIARGEGPYLYDVDGNKFIDYVLSWGPLILGHAHPGVVQAVQEAAARGTSYGAPTEAEIVLAELICEAVPSVEKVRLVNSGTEATLSAIRLARGVTGRNKIVKFAGNYHGHVDSLLVAAGSSAATHGVPTSPGVTPGTAADTIVLRYNDVNAVDEAFARWGREIAAVIVEPIAGNMGTVPATGEFLRALRELTRQHGALLIFDEVMTGFRVAYGGAQELVGIRPDITTFGKVIGGGLPVGAYGGPAEIMDHMLPVGKIFQAGTLSGNPLATAAGIATLQILKRTNPYPQLGENTRRIAEGLTVAAREAGISCQVQWVPAMFTIFFTDRPVVDWESASACDTGRFARFFWGMIHRGVYLPCSQFEAAFLSVVHTPELIDETIAAAREVLTELASEKGS